VEYDCSTFLILHRIVIVNVGMVFCFASSTLHSQCGDQIDEIFRGIFLLPFVFKLLFHLFLLINEDYLRRVNEVLVDHLLVSQLLVPFFGIKTNTNCGN
jgi:hypothetical protein